MMPAKEIIEKLQLEPHPEGGFYRETYRSTQRIVLDSKKIRNTSTAIYYLLKEGDKSHFHRICSDEIWLFHQGTTLEILLINPLGQLETKLLGNAIEQGEELQAVIPANTWFAARLKNGSGYTLVSCVVAPGFDFSDFELGKKEVLLKNYPHLHEEIKELGI